MYRAICRIANVPSFASVPLSPEVGNDCRGCLPTHIIPIPPSLVKEYIDAPFCIKEA
jgi:hypothetical protein